MSKVIYRCSRCGGKDVQLLFPVWVNANDIDDKEKYELDFEAQPEKDSDKCWCNDCQEHQILVQKEEDAKEVASE